MSDTQLRVMRYIARHCVNHGCSTQIAGHGRGPWLSAARALVRKGLAMPGSSTGHYRLTESGYAVLNTTTGGKDG